MAIPMPGPYEVPQVIQQILQRRREESRQAMLDKLQEDQTRAQIAAEQRRIEQGDEQIGIDRSRLGVQQAAEKRAAEMDAAQREEITERTRTARLGRVAPYTSLDQLPSDLAGDARASGMVKRGSYGYSGPDTGQTLEEALATVKAPEVFTGTPEFQQAELARRRAGEYARGLKGDDPLRQVIEARVAGVEGVSPDDVRPSRHVYMTPDGKYSPVREFPAGTQVTEGNWPPSAYQSAVTFLGTTDQGVGKFMTNRIDPKTGMPVIMEVPGIGQLTRPGTESPSGNRLTQAVANLNREMRTPGRDRAQRVAVAKSGILAANQNMSLPAQQALSYIIDDLDRATASTGRMPSITSIPGVIDAARQRFPQLTPEDLQEINTILRIYFSPEAQQ